MATLSQQTNFMQVLTTGQIMDAQPFIDKIRSNTKDPTLLVRFYNLHNGTDIWIEGLCWRNYDFDMVEFLHEEFGIDLHPTEVLSYDVLDSNDEMVKRHCFKKGQNDSLVFSKTAYDELNDALVDFDESVIDAAVASGIPLAKIDSDVYLGCYKDFKAFATSRFQELELFNIPEEYRKYIDYDVVAESYEQGYYFCDGHVFDANYR